jgi:hypothetical protein
MSEATETRRVGRPSGKESAARALRFIRLLEEGTPYEEAAAVARVDPARALKILTALARVRDVEV